MKRTLKWGTLIAAALVLIALALGLQTWCAKPLSINWFYTRVFARFALDNPELLTSLRLLEPVGIRGHNGKFSDSSEAHQDANAAQWRDDLATLRSYNSASYTGQDRLSYDIFEYFVNDRVKGERGQRRVFVQNVGPQIPGDCDRNQRRHQKQVANGEAGSHACILPQAQ